MVAGLVVQDEPSYCSVIPPTLAGGGADVVPAIIADVCIPDVIPPRPEGLAVFTAHPVAQADPSHSSVVVPEGGGIVAKAAVCIPVPPTIAVGNAGLEVQLVPS